MAMWAGVQKLSRPMERCQETSHAPPIVAEVTAMAPHQTYHGTEAVRLAICGWAICGRAICGRARGRAGPDEAAEGSGCVEADMAGLLDWLRGGRRGGASGVGL